MAAELTPMMRQYLAIKREVPAGGWRNVLRAVWIEGRIGTGGGGDCGRGGSIVLLTVKYDNTVKSDVKVVPRGVCRFDRRWGIVRLTYGKTE